MVHDGGWGMQGGEFTRATWPGPAENESPRRPREGGAGRVGGAAWEWQSLAMWPAVQQMWQRISPGQLTLRWPDSKHLKQRPTNHRGIQGLELSGLLMTEGGGGHGDVY